MRLRLFFIFPLLFHLTTFAVSAEAGELYGKKFKDQIEFKDTQMKLKGLGLKTFLLVKVLVAGLYEGTSMNEEDLLKNVPKRIEVAYFYPIPGKKLAKETRRRIKLNTTKEEYSKIKKRVDVMDGYFVDLKPGDRYALTYIPQAGTHFTYNGQLEGVIEGVDFARALFAVWIGEKPISQTLKANLLSDENIKID